MTLDATLVTPALTIYTDESGFAALKSEWNGLLARSSFNSIFLTWEWQTTWWNNLGHGDLLLLAWRDQTGVLIGIAPLYRVCDEDGCSFHLVGCVEVADYLDIIIAEGREAEVYSDFLQFLLGPDAPEWDSIHLCNVYESSGTYQMLPKIAEAAGLQAVVEQEDVAPYLVLASSFDHYLAGISKKRRHEIRRKRRKLDNETEQWRWFEIRQKEGLEAWVDRFIELHRLASADKQDFMTAEMALFFHNIAHMAANMGWLSLAFIEIDGELASAMFNFDYDGRIWVYNSGYNPHIYGSLSPGIVLTSHLIENAIESGHQVFDFLQGDEVYKYRFGAVDAKVMRVVIAR